MNKIILSVIFFMVLGGLALANNSWYSTLQGSASDVEQSIPPNGVTIAYNTTDHEWEFNYGLAPSGGTLSLIHILNQITGWSGQDLSLMNDNLRAVSSKTGIQQINVLNLSLIHI